MTVYTRHAGAHDVPWLLDQLERFDEFFATPPGAEPLRHRLWASRDEAEPMLRHLVETQVFLVADRDGVPVGFIAGAIGPHLFNPRLIVLTELFWWVDPAERRGRAGALLLDAFEEVGREHAHWVIMTLEAHSPVRPESLEARGWRLHERSFLKET